MDNITMKRVLEKTIRYFLYARKSSESEDRQVLSIESQVGELNKIGEKNGFEIISVFSESRSAIELGRPVFNEMMARIEHGEANGILCWKLDRLARNMVDGGKIMNALQTGVIQHIRTFERDYHPQDNVLLMSVEFGMANQYSRDLSVNVTRGLRKKAEMGWYPVQPPLGYLNSKIKGKGSNDIFKDSERFILVRKAWELMLTGAYTPPKILDIATNEWGLRTRRGMKISKGNIYHLFSNPFYYGMFDFPRGSGNWYQGSHEPMITAEEYDRVQALLGRKGRPRPKNHIFNFTGTMTCGECGLAITAEIKKKIQKNGNVHSYIYYHCTKRRTPKCTQGVIEEKEIIAQILKEISELEIPQEFHTWAIKWLENENAAEIGSRETTLNSQRKAYDESLRKLDRCIEMRMREELTEEEFKTKKAELLKEKDRLNELINDTDHRVTRWAQKMDDVLMFVATARERFISGTPEVKRQILLALGSNPMLKDRKVLINLNETLFPMKKLSGEVQKIHKRFEPQKNLMKQADYERIYSHSPIVSAQ